MEEFCWMIERPSVYYSQYTALKCKTDDKQRTFNVWLQNCYGDGEHLYVKTKQEAIDVLEQLVKEEIEFLQERLSQILAGDIEE